MGKIITYDNNGHILTITQDGITYYYTTDKYGNFLTIKNDKGEVLVEYTRDECGRIMTFRKGDNLFMRNYRDTEGNLLYSERTKDGVADKLLPISCSKNEDGIYRPISNNAKKHN